MAFWGVELKPGKPFTHNFESERGRLHVSQATLGTGSTNKKSIVQCIVGDKKPIYLCSLLPEKLETCPLNLEFEEEEEVTFLVIGSHNVHLSGFFYGESEDCCGNEYGSDLYEEDAAETDSESDDSIEFEYDTENEDEDGATDDDFRMYPPSPIPNSGVKIEEIVEDEKPKDENAKSKRQKKKKNQSNGTDDTENSERQIVVKSNTGSPLLESEDEDGFPISAPNESKAKSVRSKLKSDGIKDQDTHEEVLNEKARDNVDERKGLKKRGRGDTSKVNDSQSRGDNVVLENNAKRNKKNKKKKSMDEELACEDGSNNNSEHAGANDEPVPVGKTEDGQRLTEEKDTEKKKKKKKNKKNQQDGKAVTEVEQDKKNESQEVEENEETKPSQLRTYGNGLVIEELAMGKPDGKRAFPGSKVGVRYIGKLKKNGKIFDSNIGQRTPFEFRLGIGQVIKGWDVGVNGMRIGDKRRLTIPPAMGYGSKGAGGAIPPNSWLVFDVELVSVK
ncbi:PREDICTED: peptidyl-prolyl cis-trans isomerase FKBP53 isoform X1 [Nicotiana attenuata]|uniref:peptidyl-prolyl cis-trans isomerase FKBP53 isoform X1 n=1 Tax=Nicotiana attenuata TaxID=49451 RepID=UPI0009047826|nr:PREDICTED: peptidyl-prolyl cis-trans isomerase FKBP53 isoform X1 [Nicotiana attenuata]